LSEYAPSLKNTGNGEEEDDQALPLPHQFRAQAQSPEAIFQMVCLPVNNFHITPHLQSLDP